jgi:hypothetical protein
LMLRIDWKIHVQNLPLSHREIGSSYFNSSSSNNNKTNKHFHLVEIRFSIKIEDEFPVDKLVF